MRVIGPNWTSIYRTIFPSVVRLSREPPPPSGPGELLATLDYYGINDTMTQLDGDLPAELRVRLGIESYARHLRPRLQQFHNLSANVLTLYPASRFICQRKISRCRRIQSKVQDKTSV